METNYIKPKQVQEKPELWVWDYVERNRSKGGFGLYLAHEDGRLELLHFNNWWSGHDEWQLEKENTRDYLLRQSSFKLILEF